jgi:release factor glutamine methyltransferase
MAHAAKQNRVWVLAHDSDQLDPKTLSLFQSFSARRALGEPVAYITGRKEFFGREFFVTVDTLIPRPATEGLIELTLKFLEYPKDETLTLDMNIAGIAREFKKKKPTHILDVGTGSGCIAITLRLEGRTEKITGVDTSKAAVAVAQKNAALFGASNILFECADGIQFVSTLDEPFLIISNPPYIPVGTVLQKDVADFEPPQALFAGSDGLEVIRPLVKVALKNSFCTGIVLELRKDQVSTVDSLLQA